MHCCDIIEAAEESRRKATTFWESKERLCKQANKKPLPRQLEYLCSLFSVAQSETKKRMSTTDSLYPMVFAKQKMTSHRVLKSSSYKARDWREENRVVCIAFLCHSGNESSLYINKLN